MLDWAHPRSGFAAFPQGGAPCGRAEPGRGVRWVRWALCLVVCAWLVMPGWSRAQAASVPASAEAPSAALDPALEARMMALAAELRCLVCQNQTLADSHAGLADDLRRQIRELLARGLSDAEVRDYMTARYGDFVLYKPPFKASTALLWIGPGLLLAVALGTLAVVLRRRQRLGDAAFDPETPDDDDRH